MTNPAMAAPTPRNLGSALRRTAVAAGATAAGAAVWGIAGAATVGGLVSALVVVEKRVSAPPYRGPRSDHFDGRRFRNLQPTERKGFLSLLRWMIQRRQGPWRKAVSAAPGKPPPTRTAFGQVRVTFIGHATVLVQMDGVNVLLDPVWSPRVGPYSWLGPKRVRPPGIRFEDLPPVDAVLVSHNHYDHLDVPTLRRIAARDRSRFLVPLGNRALLESRRITGAEDLDWWQSVTLPNGLTVTAVPARHWSGRGATDRERTFWCGFVIEGPNGVIYYAGDTADGIHFERVAARWPRIDLAILPIGAFRPEWFMKDVHLSPAEAVAAHRRVGAERSLAVHFGTFPLADDGETEAVEALREALGQDPAASERFWVLGFGEGRDLSRSRPGGQ